MNEKIQQQHLNNIVNCIEEIQAATSNLTYEQFRKEEQVKEIVYTKLQMMGAAAYELSNSSDHVEGLNFNTDVLAGFRNARYNEEAEINHQSVWNVINDLDAIHSEALKVSKQLEKPE